MTDTGVVLWKSLEALLSYSVEVSVGCIYAVR